MKINVGHIPEEGLNLQFDKDGEWLKNTLPEKEKSELSLQRADVVCSVRKLKETIYIEGSLETTMTANCSRCLEVTSFPIKSNFRYTLVPAAKRIKEEQELSSEDLDFSFYDNELIDLDTMLYEQIMLQIPIKVLCGDTCKGLCPHCGTDLNTASCNYLTGFVDERLAILKKFKKEE
ncbi:MAG: DUF177 domain-containing protein [Deltaproteobacteria bacterium]|nr:DUF177 domain-containing protein [Deltaproteobacteria bacterium]